MLSHNAKHAVERYILAGLMSLLVVPLLAALCLNSTPAHLGTQLCPNYANLTSLALNFRPRLIIQCIYLAKNRGTHNEARE